MRLEFRYLLKQYFINFFIVAFGLTFAATLIDFIHYSTKISGFNRKILYFVYTFSDLFIFTYSIALVFGAVIVLSKLLSKNYLIAFYSFGYSKSSILKPFLIGSFLIYFIIVGLNFTKFAYFGDSAISILKEQNRFSSLNNIFFKYNNNFVFAKRLDNIKKEFSDVTLYVIENKKLIKMLQFKKANFRQDRWIAKDILKKEFIYVNGVPKGYKESIIKEEEILQGYYPKVITLLYEGQRMSIDDGIKALLLLKKQNLDSSKIKASLYSKIFMPLFAPFLIIIIFAYLPSYKRYMSRAKFMFLTMGLTLIIWTLLYSLNMLSVNGVIDADFGVPVLIFILFIVSILIWFKKANSF